MLQDEPLEYIKEQYAEKNDVLSNYGEQVSAITMYEDIFGDTAQEMPIVIIDDDETKHIVVMSIDEAVAQAETRNDILMGGCTYFNNWICKKSARYIYSFIIDMDNVYSGTLLNALRNDWKTATNDPLPMPTYIVNSGTGLHLYFVLKEPIPNYKVNASNLDKVYRTLAEQQTTRRVYLRKQIQWFGQDFRMAGGLNKYDWQNTVFRVGKKWDIDDLAKEVLAQDTHFVRYGESRTFKTSSQNRKKTGKRKGWKSNRAFYDYALKNCHEKTREGNRYQSMCALSVIAWKCGVPKEELQRDLIDLIPEYNKGATRLVKQREVFSAMKMYNDKAMLTQRQSLETWQGWVYQPIKRNGRKRAEHLKRARAVQAVDYPNHEWAGRPSKENLIREYLDAHPRESVAEMSKKLNVSRTTIYKYCKDKQRCTKVVQQGCLRKDMQ